MRRSATSGTFGGLDASSNEGLGERGDSNNKFILAMFLRRNWQQRMSIPRGTLWFKVDLDVVVTGIQ